MNRTRIKVCGITNPLDAEYAVNCGVDAIGMILHANSPRLANKEIAYEIRQVVPAFVTLVGVFVDADSELVQSYYHDIGLDLIQLHGAESEKYCNDLGLPFIKALRVKNRQQLMSNITQYAQCRAFLLDPYVQGQHGGTGKQLDENLWPESSSKKLILAGGLSVKNISAALNKMKPYAVDVNSGIENSPGNKNHEHLAEFVNLVTNNDLKRF